MVGRIIVVLNLNTEWTVVSSPLRLLFPLFTGHSKDFGPGGSWGSETGDWGVVSDKDRVRCDFLE